MTKILLFGTGGVGSIYTYILTRAGASVTAVCRSNYDAVSQHGIHIDSKIFGSVHVEPKVVRSCQDAIDSGHGPFDYILICSKATVGVTPSTADLIAPAVSPGTSIVLCQNGIGIEKPYALGYPNNILISGVLYLPTTEETPGHVSMGDLERLEIGSFPSPATPAGQTSLERLAQFFEDGGATCCIYEDIQAQRWRKIMVNGSWNPICALTLLSDADFLRSSDVSEDFVRSVMREIMGVAHTRGYTDITEGDIKFQMDRPRKRLQTEGKEPSMLTDVRFGRGLEVEAILGNLIKIAKEVGVDVPRCEVIYALAKGLDYAVRRGQRVGEAPG